MWLIIVLVSVFILAATELYQKSSLTTERDVSIFVNNFFVSVFMCVLSLIVGGVWAIVTGQGIDFSHFWLLLLNGVVFFIGSTIFYSSYKGISSSLGTMLGSISVVFSTAWGIIFLSESISWGKFAGVALILVAIVLVNYTTEKAKLKYVLMAIIGGVLFSITYSLDKTFLTSSTLNPMLYLGFMTIITGILNFIFGYKEVVRELKTVTWPHIQPMFMVGLFAVIFNVMTYIAYTVGGEVGKIDAINSTVCFIILIGEFIFLHDRKNVLKKAVAITLAFIGIILLA